jgi:hypothetical protein
LHRPGAGAGEENFYSKSLGLQPCDDGVVKGQMAGCAWFWQFIGDK